MTEDAELFVDLTDDSREDGVRSFALPESAGDVRFFQVTRTTNGALIEIIDRIDTVASIHLSQNALSKAVRALVRFDFVEKDWNASSDEGSTVAFRETTGE